jgi:hypothetical protein
VNLRFEFAFLRITPLVSRDFFNSIKFMCLEFNLHPSSVAGFEGYTFFLPPSQVAYEF